MNEKPLILITGANGFTGQHACSYFAGQGMDVIPVSRTETYRKGSYKGIICDLTDERVIASIISTIQPDYVLHLAGVNAVNDSWENPLHYFRANVLGTLHLVEAIRKGSPKSRVLIAGSALQYEPMKETPPHPYSFTKTLQIMVSEAWEKMMNVDLLIAKPTNLIGPGHSNGICAILGKKIVAMENEQDNAPIKLNNLQAQRDFLDVRDAVKGYYTILKHGKQGETYPMGFGVSRSLQEIVEQYEKLTSKTFDVRSGVEQAEFPVKIDLSRVKQLGWKTQYSLTTSLKDILDFYRGRNDQIFKE